MRNAHFDPAARKQTISLTVNSDLYAKAKRAEINASRIAEDALANALAQRVAEQVRAEIRQDLEACNLYVAEHGSPRSWCARIFKPTMMQHDVFVNPVPGRAAPIRS